MVSKKILVCSKCNKEILIKDIRRLKEADWKIKPLTADKINLEKHQIQVDKAKGGKWRITVASAGLKPEMLKLLPIKIDRRTFQRRIEILSLKVLGKKI